MKKQLLLLLITFCYLTGFSQVTEITGNYIVYSETFSFDSKMMIVSKNDNNHIELWQVNDQNIAELYVTLPDTTDDYYTPYNFKTLNNKIYYIGYVDSTLNLMEIDGNTISAITNYPKITATTTYGLTYSSDVLVFDNKIYFTAYNSASTREFMYYDGTQLNSINTGDVISNLFILKNKLYFSFSNSSSTNHLAYLDNNNQIQELMGDYYVGSMSYTSMYNGDFYFQATDTIHGNELFKTDGTTVSFVYDLRPSSYTSGTNDVLPNSSSTYPIFEFKNKLYLAVQNAEINGYTGGGTFTYDDNNNQVEKDEVLHSIGNDIGFRAFNSVIFNDKLYYAINDTIHGNELYVYDGTNTPTLLMDVNPGQANSNPGNYTILNNKLYFTEEKGTNYRLWLIEDETIENISEMHTLEVSASPNPTKGIINFESQEQIKTIEIYDIRGQKVISFNNTNTIDIATLTNGLYFAKVISESNKTAIHHIVKK